MEKKLSQLFDFQKFEGNRELKSVIDSVHARYSRIALDDDDVCSVAAAGAPEAGKKKPKPWEKEK